MYIPDHIKIVSHGPIIKVWSDDEGDSHAVDGPLQVADVTIRWNELYGLSAVVEYGTRIQAVGEPAASIIRVEYDAAHIAVDWKCYPLRMRQGMKQAKE